MRRIIKATPEMVQQLYAVVGVPVPTEPLETVTFTITEDHLIKIVETRLASEEVVPVIPKMPA